MRIKWLKKKKKKSNPLLTATFYCPNIYLPEPMFLKL
jgi:hypothetical protein